jgi:hypothetical protein
MAATALFHYFTTTVYHRLSTGSTQQQQHDAQHRPPQPLLHGWWLLFCVHRNQYQGNIHQSDMEAAFRALSNPQLGPRAANGGVGGQSLAQLGYNDAGLDDVWQKCGAYGPNKYTYHDANGNPVVDTAKFPDFKRMTDLAHSLNLTAGWLVQLFP